MLGNYVYVGPLSQTTEIFSKPQAQEISVLIAYTQMPLINVYVDVHVLVVPSN